MVKSFKQK